jgi:hypothetical protein
LSWSSGPVQPPPWASSTGSDQCDQRARNSRGKTPKIQISDAGFWKSVLQRFHAPQKKSKQSVCADETGRQKKKLRKRKVLRALHLSVAVDKNKNRHGALTERLLGYEKKYFLRTLPPSHFCAKVTKKYFPCCAGDTAFAEATGHKKVTARAVKTEQTATGHKNKKLRARHKSVAVTGQKERKKN